MKDHNIKKNNKRNKKNYEIFNYFIIQLRN